MNKIILGAGCYWSVEALIRQLKGIHNINPGYYSMKNSALAIGTKDKIEVVKFEYDDSISIDTILDFFFTIHNPTINSWNEDSFFPSGRSVIFYFNDNDKNKSFDFIQTLIKNKSFDTEIYTKILPGNEDNFILSEAKYIDYYNKYPTDPFSTSNIEPKLIKVKEKFKDFIK